MNENQSLTQPNKAASRRQGQLTVFLGYADGVGKTHAMIEAALQEQARGVRVCIGHIKLYPHAAYTELAQKLVSVPLQPQQLSFCTIDINALMDYQPELVLIDDLHEVNLSGAEYERRYQDVQVILDAGIDVYTTLNVYALESVSDIVEQLTGIRFEATIPDRLIDRAKQIELVDVPVEIVIRRYTDRQMAPPKRADIGRLMNEQVLTGLRQLALRQTSHWVEAHWHREGKQRASLGSISTREHVMVCISASPLNSKLIRAAYQLVQEIRADWTAVYVEGTSKSAYDETSQQHLIQNMRLVEKLGGEVVVIHGDSVSDALMRYARQHEITKIVVGYPTQSRWYELLYGSIVNRLIQQNQNIDVYVINSGQPSENFGDLLTRPDPVQWSKYVLTIAIIISATLLDIFIQPFVFPATLVTLYLLGIMAAASYLGARPALIATVLSAVSFFFFFVPSSVDTPVESLPYLAILVGLMLAGIVVTRFITGAVNRANIANRRADQMMELYSLSRDISMTVAFDGIIETIITHAKQTFQAEVSLFLNQGDTLQLYKNTPGMVLTELEETAAREAHRFGRTTGFGTAHRSDATATYLPLRTAYKNVGVLGITLPEHKLPTLDQRRMIDAFANQAALAIEASRLSEQAHQARLAQEREKLQSALLDSISHDLRTPLVAITGALSSLRNETELFDAQMRSELLDDAWLEAERLNRLVENLLEMSRLQSGELVLNRDWHDLDEVIAVARSQLRERLRGYEIVTHTQPDAPLIFVDFTLLVQVVVNLLDNAVKYTSESKIIEICTKTEDTWFILQIADQGYGIPEAEQQRIFDKFFRASNVNHITGTGVGLSICAGIVAAHGGTIQARNRPEGGALFEVRLPKENFPK